MRFFRGKQGMIPGLLASAAALLACAAVNGQVVISEFMAADNAVWADEDGGFGDWIELRNTGASVVNLAGWRLSDDACQPAKWTFPATNLPAGGFLVVAASGKDRRQAGRPLHTNFKLDASGEYLALSAPDGATVAPVFAPFPPQYGNLAYGLANSLPGAECRYLSPATPGRENGSGFPALAQPVRVSPAGGIFASNLLLRLESPETGAVIRYTTNNTIPNETSPIYAAPIPLEASATVRARAYVPGRLPSAPVAEAYTLLAPDLLEFKSNLPLIILDTYGQQIMADMAERAAVGVTIINTSAVSGLAACSGAPDFHGQGGLEGRGQTSWNFTKKPYNLALRNSAGEDTSAEVLGLPPGAEWALLNLINDKSLMNDFLAQELFEKMGHYAVRRRYVEVFLNGPHPDHDDTSGKVSASDYLGVYLLLEKIQISEHRLDLAQLKESDATEPEVTGGYIFKKDKTSPSDVTFTTISGQTLTYHDPKGSRLTEPQRDWLAGYINEFENALYGPNWLDPAEGYAKYIDVDSFVDYHWIVEFSKQFDGYRFSNYLHKDRGGKITAGPIWDWNVSFGNVDDNDIGLSKGWYYTNLSPLNHLWLSRLVQTPGDPDFIQRIADRWSVLRTNVFAVSKVLGRMDELTAYLHEAQAREFARWPRLGVYYWPNPPALAAATSHQAAVNYVKSWITKRFAWVDSQFLAPPGMSRPEGPVQAGDLVTLSTAQGDIFYTLDGTDPRLPGGAISGSATKYAGPIALQDNARVFARTFYTNAWSGPAAATFYTHIPALAITEIMYHPMGCESLAAEDLQYLELMNTGDSPLALAGFHFTQGIEFTFTNGTLAPGQRVLVVKNRAAFEARYGTGLNLGGIFTHDLSNNGERLTLVGPLGEPVLDFVYRVDWQPETDGGGYSLVVTDPTADFATWGEATQWTCSENPGGNQPAASPLTIQPPIQLSGEVPAVRIFFTAVAGQACRIEHTDTLAGGTWETLAEFPAPATTQTLAVSDPIGTNQPTRYYRLRAR